MMYVLLFVLDVSMLSECKGDINAGVENGGRMVAVNVWHECVAGTDMNKVQQN